MGRLGIGHCNCLQRSFSSSRLSIELFGAIEPGGDLPIDATLTDRLTHELQQNLIQASVSTAVDAMILGKEPDDAVRNNLTGAASATLGVVVAQRIGLAASADNIDRTTQLIALNMFLLAQKKDRTSSLGRI